MSRKIQVIINRSNTKLGKKGNVIKVKQGYALNYLIPNNLAEQVTQGKLKHLEMLKLIETSKLQTEYNKAYKVEKSLSRITKISLTKKLGKQKQIFGKITEKEIIEKIYLYTGEQIEKKQIIIPSMKEVGIYNLQVKILNHISTNHQIQVLPLNLNTNF